LWHFTSSTHPVLIEAEIDSFGPRSLLDEDRRRKVLGERPASLGTVAFERIEVAPFSVARFGIEFGWSHVHPKTMTTLGQ
jgi:hypothetical protein